MIDEFFCGSCGTHKPLSVFSRSAGRKKLCVNCDVIIQKRVNNHKNKGTTRYSDRDRVDQFLKAVDK